MIKLNKHNIDLFSILKIYVSHLVVETLATFAYTISNNIYLGKMAAIILSKIVKPLIKCPFTGV